MLRNTLIISLWLCAGWLAAAQGVTNSSKTLDLGRPMSLADALNYALRGSPAVRMAQKDLEASQGVVLRTTAIAFPKIQALGDYTAREPASVDQPVVNIPGFTFGTDQSWSSQARLVQSIYEGGRMSAALGAARLIKDRALLNYQTAVADLVLEVELAYYDTLLAEKQIEVREASAELLEKELLDSERRLAAGTVPRFNVLRAEVELANARPPLVRARNSLRITRNRLTNVIGLSIPPGTPEDMPLLLTDKLAAEPLTLGLQAALDLARARRTELASLRRTGALRREEVKTARAGYKPRLQAFGGYEWSSSMFNRDLTDEVHGWLTGVQLTWNLFDGFETQGRVKEAAALMERAEIELEDAALRVDLEVRTAYSRFLEARELLVSQEKVIEQGEEALRLANARSEAGTGTQLDVLGAQTALTEARTQHNVALHGFAVARARLQRAVGNNVPDSAPAPR